MENTAKKVEIKKLIEKHAFMMRELLMWQEGERDFSMDEALEMWTQARILFRCSKQEQSMNCYEG